MLRVGIISPTPHKSRERPVDRKLKNSGLFIGFGLGSSQVYKAILYHTLIFLLDAFREKKIKTMLKPRSKTFQGTD